MEEETMGWGGCRNKKEREKWNKEMKIKYK